MTDELIKYLISINSRLNALLAIEVNRISSEAEGKREQRGIEILLSDAGLGTSEIARLIGKTQRAAQKALAKERGGDRGKKELEDSEEEA